MSNDCNKSYNVCLVDAECGILLKKCWLPVQEPDIGSILVRNRDRYLVVGTHLDPETGISTITVLEKPYAS